MERAFPQAVTKGSSFQPARLLAPQQRLPVVISCADVGRGNFTETRSKAGKRENKLINIFHISFPGFQINITVYSSFST